MIVICPSCSAVDLVELQNALGDVELQEGCIGECGKPYIACVNGNYIESKSQEGLIKAIKENI